MLTFGQKVVLNPSNLMVFESRCRAGNVLAATPIRRVTSMRRFSNGRLPLHSLPCRSLSSLNDCASDIKKGRFGLQTFDNTAQHTLARVLYGQLKSVSLKPPTCHESYPTSSCGLCLICRFRTFFTTWLVSGQSTLKTEIQKSGCIYYLDDAM